MLCLLKPIAMMLNAYQENIFLIFMRYKYSIKLIRKGLGVHRL